MSNRRDCRSLSSEVREDFLWTQSSADFWQRTHTTSKHALNKTFVFLTQSFQLLNCADKYSMYTKNVWNNVKKVFYSIKYFEGFPDLARAHYSLETPPKYILYELRDWLMSTPETKLAEGKYVTAIFFEF